MDRKLQKMLVLAFLRLSFLIYYTVTIIFRLCFMPQYNIYDISYGAVAVDYAVDMFFWVDFITAHAGSSSVSPNPSQVSRHRSSSVPKVRYRKTLQILQILGLKNKLSRWKIIVVCAHYLVEIFSLVPLELIGFAAGISNFQQLRVFRLLRIRYYMQYWMRLCEMMYLAKIMQNRSIQRFWILTTTLAITGHVFACLFYRIGIASLHAGIHSTWVVQDGLVALSAGGALVENFTLNYRYLRAMYWSIQTLDTVGFGDIAAKNEAETWFCTLYFYVAVYLVYNSIANFITLITSIDWARTKTLQKKARFAKYAKYRMLPKELSLRVASYYDFQWQTLQGTDEAEILRELPPNLSQQLHQHVIRDLFINIPSFKDLNKGVLNALSDNVEIHIFSPDDIVVDFDSVVTGAHIVGRGEVGAISVTGEVLEILRSKEVFGLQALAASFTTTKSYQARSFAEIVFLRGSVYRHIINVYVDKKDTASQLSTEASRPDGNDEVMKERTSLRGRHSTMLVRWSNSIRLIRRGSSSSDLIKHVNNTAASIYDSMKPMSRSRKAWDAVIFAGLIFYFTSIGLLLSASLRPAFFQDMKSLLIVSYVVDGIFAVDMLLQARFFGYQKDGVIVLDAKQIWQHFWATNNPIIVVLSIVPFDAIIAFNTTLRVLPTLRLLKLLHLRYFNVYMERFFETLGETTGHPVSFELSRFITLYFFLFEVCHWAGCFWILSADIGVDVFHYPTNWILQDHQFGVVDVDYTRMPAVVYSRSIYWAVSVMSSIGFPDMIPNNSVEIVTLILVMFIGYLLFFVLLSGIANLISSFNADKREFHARVDKMRNLMAYTKVPTSIEGRVVRYYEYVWSRFSGVDEKEILASLPKTLRADVVYHVVGPLVRHVPFFADLSEPMEHMLLSLFESRIVLDGDALVTFGDMGKEMFVIEKGVIQITNADRSLVFATLGAKDYIGESCLLEMTPRTASAYAVGYVDTFFITTENFMKVAEVFPSEYQAITDAVQAAIDEKKRKNEALRLEREAAKAADAKAAAECRGEECVASDVSEAKPDLSQRQTIDSGSHVSLAGRRKRVVPSSEIPAMTARRMPVFLEWLHMVFNTFVTTISQPDSDARMWWNVLIFSSLVYYLIMIPLRITLRIESDIYVLDYFFDACNILDGVFCANVFTIFRDGEVVSSRLAIWRIYVHDRLWIDIMAFLPYDLLALLVSYRSVSFVYFVRALLRIPKLFKVSILGRYYGHVERLVGYMKIHPLLFRFVEVTLLFLTVAFYVACGWYLFASYQFVAFCHGVVDAPDTLPCKFFGTWVEQQYLSFKLPVTGGTQWARFLRSINFAIPILTGEFITDIRPWNEQESFFAFLVMFCGLTVNGAIVGNIVSVVSDANEETTRLYRQREQLREYLHTNSLPKHLVQTSTAFLSYLISAEGSMTLKRDSMFSELPHALKVDIDLHLKTLPYLRRCTFFDFCSDDILRGIAAQLRVQLYTKGDKIISAGDLGHEMFFLQSGTVDVVGGDESTGYTVYSTLEEGAFFGETGLFFKKPRVATIVVSSPICVCLCLQRDDLDLKISASDYNNGEVLRAFQYLQEMNQRRNTAVHTNLKVAEEEAGSKLHKLLKTSDESLAAASTLQYIRMKMCPESAFRFCWDTLGLIILLYYIFSIPFFIAFLSHEKLTKLTQYVTFEILFNLYWIIDIVLKLFLFSYRVDIISNTLAIDGDLIFRRYMDSYFWYDVVASIPSEMLILYPGVDYLAVFILRFCHLIRVSQLNSYTNMLEKHLRRRFALAMGRTAGLVVKAGIVYVILNHWLACGYFLIHRYPEVHSELTWATVDGISTYDPITGRHDVCSKTIRYCYARSVYLVMGIMSSVGYGDIQPYTDNEIMWQQVTVICGAYIAAICVGYLGGYQTDEDARNDHAFRAKLRQVDQYLQFRQVPSNLHEAIVTQYHYLWQKHRSLQGEKHELLGLLSAPSRLEILRHLHGEIMETVPIMKEAAGPLKRRLASILHPQIALPDSVIYRAGDVGKAVFFVSTGEVHVTLSTDRSTLDPFGLSALRILLHKEQHFGTSYTAGAHFGEFCLLSKSGLRADYATAKSTTEMNYLVKDELWEVFQYMTQDIRQDFVYRLMTRVGGTQHIPWPTGSVSTNPTVPDGGGLYELVGTVVENLTAILVQDVSSQESSDDDDGENKNHHSADEDVEGDSRLQAHDEQSPRHQHHPHRPNSTQMTTHNPSWTKVRALIRSEEGVIKRSGESMTSATSVTSTASTVQAMKKKRMSFSAVSLQSRLSVPATPSVAVVENMSDPTNNSANSHNSGVNTSGSSGMARMDEMRSLRRIHSSTSGKVATTLIEEEDDDDNDDDDDGKDDGDEKDGRKDNGDDRDGVEDIGDDHLCARFNLPESDKSGDQESAEKAADVVPFSSLHRVRLPVAPSNLNSSVDGGPSDGRKGDMQKVSTPVLKGGRRADEREEVIAVMVEDVDDDDNGVS